MTKRMLIDANHPEETRVVVLDGTRLDEFDVETSTKKQLKGNIYLAKIVRVEPSLQAAFVDYGGNRHGFLAFNEIHPDYYQIPLADRERLIAEQVALAESEDDDDEDGADAEDGDTADNGTPGDAETSNVEEATPQRRLRPRPSRSYKIQDVIKRRQIVLVQVVKEERGNKGAALTTYLSLAGRYCVFMPNTTRGGGVSRKITSAADRKRLKSIMSELTGPKGSAIILRTAGSERSKAEIKRDHDYLLRTWETIRQTTLTSRAPCLIHEEGSLIKRAIRDIYSRDIEEVLVEGEIGYRMAKDFMRMLTPSHAKRVQPYTDDSMPLFHRFQVESQMDAMLQPIAQLKSGGYLVINQTEALVAIDVNSGRSTRERNIEETAYKTNLEAADEIARQLRLRDLAGLIVIDFIDMDDPKYNAAVERRLKEALRHDRARIQIGRISAFGLLEMSRQRLRPSLMETSFQPCPHCRGAGVVRSVESTAIHILRIIEEEGVRRRSSEVTVFVPTAVALYILNYKRATLAAMEQRHDFTVLLQGDDTLIIPDHRMERVKAETPRRETPVLDLPAPVEEPEDEIPEEEDDDEGLEAAGGENVVETDTDTDTDENGSRKRRRRRRRRRKEQDSESLSAEAPIASEDDTDEDTDEAAEEESASPEETAQTPGTAEEDSTSERRRSRRRRARRRERPMRDDLPAAALVDPEMADEIIGTLPPDQDEPERPSEIRTIVIETVDTEPAAQASAIEDSAPPPPPEAPTSLPPEEPEPVLPEGQDAFLSAAPEEAPPVASAPSPSEPASTAPALDHPWAEAAPTPVPAPAPEGPPPPRRVGWWSRLMTS